MSYESLSHSRWSCTYHVVFVPKCRRKSLYGKIRTYLGPCFTSWRCRKSARLSRVTWCRTTATWSSTFRRSTRVSPDGTRLTWVEADGSVGGYPR